MTPFLKTARRLSVPVACLLALALVARASVDDAQSFALQAAEPYVKEGFQVREDYWGGDLAAGEKKAVRQQLFKGNEYWFWLGPKSKRQKSPSTFTIRKASWWSSLTAGRKATSRPPMSSRRARGVILSSSRLNSRPRNELTGPSFTDSANPTSGTRLREPDLTLLRQAVSSAPLSASWGAPK